MTARRRYLAPGWLERILARLKTLKGAEEIVAIAGVGCSARAAWQGYLNAYQAARGSTQSQAQMLALVGKGDAGPLSIIVLPFANLTGDPEQSYVADGLTAAIASDLSRIRDAFIVSTVTAFAYKDRPVTVQQIGKELGVRFALQGGVQRSGDRFGSMRNWRTRRPMLSSGRRVLMGVRGICLRCRRW